MQEKVKMMMMLVLLVAIASARCIYASGDVLLTPVKHGGQEVALLLVQAPEVKPAQLNPCKMYPIIPCG